MFKIRLIATFLVVYLILGPSAQFFSVQFFVPAAKAQNQLPKDKRYWKYHSWYKNHSLLFLVVSGLDKKKLEQSMRSLKRLKKRGVLVAEVMIVGEPNTSSETSDPISKIFSELSLSQSGMEDPSIVLKKYDIKSSPTWIVRYKGKDYVYEGLKNPERLFNTQGQFLSGNRGSGRNVF